MHIIFIIQTYLYKCIVNTIICVVRCRLIFASFLRYNHNISVYIRYKITLYYCNIKDAVMQVKQAMR